MKWQILNKQTPHNVEDVVKLILGNRQISNPQVFLQPPNPTAFTAQDLMIDEQQLKLCLKRLELAKTNQEQVIIYGDYDADGVCATAILTATLLAWGLNVQPFIPHRIDHGYGLSVKGLTQALEITPASLIITVDNGIVAHPAAEWLKAKNIDLIISDHHLEDSSLPLALAIVHTTQLTGAGVAWFLARQVLPEVADKYLDIAAVATVADIVPLVGANRSMVVWGLKQLKSKPSLGLSALMITAQLDKKPINSMTISYGIAPRLNAAGRLETGDLALQLLLASDIDKAMSQARNLQTINLQRQSLTEDSIKIAIGMAQAQAEQAMLVIGHTSFHEGIIGLVAGKLVEKYRKPVLVVALGSEFSKGSGRSILGINLVELLRSHRDLFLELGGHPQAAGCGLKTNNFSKIQTALWSTAAKTIIHDDINTSLEVDAVLPVNLLSLKLPQSLTSLEPYGQGNREPVFLIKSAIIKSAQTMGANKIHLRLQLAWDNLEFAVNAVWWQASDKLSWLMSLKEINMVAKLHINSWQGRDSLQLQIVDIKPAGV